MHRSTVLVALPLLAVAGMAAACPFERQASRPMVMADNAATATPSPAGGKAPDAAAYPNSPNGSPMTGAKGAPVVTDKAACGTTTAGPSTGCEASPAPSGKADTSDTAIATPTTVNAKPATP